MPGQKCRSTGPTPWYRPIPIPSGMPFPFLKMFSFNPVQTVSYPGIEAVWMFAVHISHVCKIFSLSDNNGTI